MTITLSRRRFEELVAEALDEIPEPFASLLDNVDVVVEDEPSAEELERAGVEPGGTLFGLYHGIPQTERGPGYTFVLPDRITIYRGPILRACADEDEVYEEVAVTVVHEIAHHFGISDERLDELGW
jgi:predicted Zn-dependent protease with MMP-like domain